MGQEVRALLIDTFESVAIPQEGNAALFKISCRELEANYLAVPSNQLVQLHTLAHKAIAGLAAGQVNDGFKVANVWTQNHLEKSDWVVLVLELEGGLQLPFDITRLACMSLGDALTFRP